MSTYEAANINADNADHWKRLHPIPTERYNSADLKISTMADL